MTSSPNRLAVTPFAARCGRDHHYLTFTPYLAAHTGATGRSTAADAPPFHHRAIGAT